MFDDPDVKEAQQWAERFKRTFAGVRGGDLRKVEEELGRPLDAFTIAFISGFKTGSKQPVDISALPKANQQLQNSFTRDPSMWGVQLGKLAAMAKEPHPVVLAASPTAFSDVVRTLENSRVTPSPLELLQKIYQRHLDRVADKTLPIEEKRMHAFIEENLLRRSFEQRMRYS